MGTTTRTSAPWLALREPADADARATDLVDEIRTRLRPGGTTTVHDLGCGTGSMARWLAGRLPGRQHWLMYDRDPDLLDIAAAAPGEAADNAPVTVEARRRDIARLAEAELAGADLIAASALLDMLTAAELDRLVAACAAPRCPVLIALSVTGNVRLAPADPLDRRIGDAFNAHQRRIVGAEPLLGPGAIAVASAAFSMLGFEVLTRPSPWRLGPEDRALASEWFAGWVGAACEQQPELAAPAQAYARRREDQLSAGQLSITVGHTDLLAVPSAP